MTKRSISPRPTAAANDDPGFDLPRLTAAMDALRTRTIALSVRSGMRRDARWIEKITRAAEQAVAIIDLALVRIEEADAADVAARIRTAQPNVDLRSNSDRR